jgi:hypothetical protein
MRVSLRRALPLTLAVVAASCILPRQGVDPLSGARGAARTKGTRQPQRGFMPKRVMGKQEPNILLASDGTSCTVTAERYRDVQLGKYELCAWR